MEKIFNINSGIDNVIRLTENYLKKLKEIQKDKGNVVLNPNYVHLLKKIFDSTEVMMFGRKH